MNKKVICWIMLVAWAGVIFYFSAQPATQSDNSSISFSYKFFSMFSFFSHLSDSGKMEFIQRFHSLIRTLAHFSIFGVLGVLATLTVRCYTDKLKKSMLISVGACFLYAVFDEIHQIFVPGRTFQYSDVAVDFCGAVMGCAFVCFILWIINLFKFIKRKMFEGS